MDRFEEMYFLIAFWIIIPLHSSMDRFEAWFFDYDLNQCFALHSSMDRFEGCCTDNKWTFKYNFTFQYG